LFSVSVLNSAEKIDATFNPKIYKEMILSNDVSNIFFHVTRVKLATEAIIEEKIDLPYYLNCVNSVLKIRGKPLTDKQISFILYCICGIEDKHYYKDMEPPSSKVCTGVSLCLVGYITQHLPYSYYRVDAMETFELGLSILLDDK